MKSSAAIQPFVRASDYATGRAVLRSKDFAVEDFLSNLIVLQDASGIDFSRLISRIENTPFFLDGDKHREVRRRMARFFSPASMEKWQPTIDELVDRVLEPLRERDEIELFDEVIDPVMLQLRMAVFGFPWIDLETTRKWDRALNLLFDTLPSLRNLKALQRLYEGVGELASKPAALPFPNAPASLRDALAEPPPGMEPLCERSLETLVGINALAAYALTTTLSNVVAQRLFEPGGLAKCADEAWLELNFHNIMRLGAAPIELGRRLASPGVPFLPDVSQGEMVRVAIRRMNVDPAFIEEGCPHALQKASQHAGFGAGPHICPGLSLSHIVTKSLLTRLAQQWPGLRLNGEDALATAEHGPLFLHNRIACAVGPRDGR